MPVSEMLPATPGTTMHLRQCGPRHSGRWRWRISASRQPEYIALL